MEKKSSFGVGGRAVVPRKELFYKSNKNKAPRKVGLSLVCSVVFYVEPSNEAVVFGCFS